MEIVPDHQPGHGRHAPAVASTERSATDKIIEKNGEIRTTDKIFEKTDSLYENGQTAGTSHPLHKLDLS